MVVKRFVIANSVEDKVLALQERKKRLARETLKAGGELRDGTKLGWRGAGTRAQIAHFWAVLNAPNVSSHLQKLRAGRIA